MVTLDSLWTMPWIQWTVFPETDDPIGITQYLGLRDHTSVYEHAQEELNTLNQ
jgi:hypothetical protein